MIDDNIKNNIDKIEHCLKKYPDTRNSDSKLTMCVWVIFYEEFLIGEGMERALPIKNLNKVMSQDNVKRIRAKFQSTKLYQKTGNKQHIPMYLPTDKKVAEKRMINEQVWREAMNTPNQSNLFDFI